MTAVCLAHASWHRSHLLGSFRAIDLPVALEFADTRRSLTAESRQVKLGSGWLALLLCWQAGTGAAALCIGETSAKAARSAGFGDVRCPESPGVEAWADTVASYYSDA